MANINNSQYAPGLSTLGLKGDTGINGKNSNNLFFTDIDIVRHVDQIATYIIKNMLPRKNTTTYLGRDYVNGDMFVDQTANVYTLYNLEGLINDANKSSYKDYFKLSGYIQLVDNDKVANMTSALYTSMNPSAYGGFDIINSANPSLYIDNNAVTNIISNNIDSESKINLLLFNAIDTYNVDRSKLLVYYDLNTASFHFASLTDTAIVLDNDVIAANTSYAHDTDSYQTVLTSDDTITKFRTFCDNNISYDLTYDTANGKLQNILTFIVYIPADTNNAYVQQIFNTVKNNLFSKVYCDNSNYVYYIKNYTSRFLNNKYMFNIPLNLDITYLSDVKKISALGNTECFIRPYKDSAPSALMFAVTEGVAYISMAHYGTNSASTAPSLEFSYNDGLSWTPWKWQPLQIVENQKLYIRGNNTRGISSSTVNYSTFQITGAPVICSGNIMYLLSYTSGLTTIPNEYCFYRLFFNAGLLSTLPTLPATSLKASCYEQMFMYEPIGNTGPADLDTNPTKQASHFSETPALPATFAVRKCYKQMFNGCKNIQKLGAVALTSTADSCCEEMFKGCFSNSADKKTNSPLVLAAINIAASAYKSMFKNCKYFDSTVTFGTDTVVIQANGCQQMFKSSGLERHTPDLSRVSTMDNNACEEMFMECSALVNMPNMKSLVTVGDSSCKSMFENCTSLSNTYTLEPQLVNSHAYERMFCNCTSLVSPPEINATDLKYESCKQMFMLCTSLSVTSIMPNFHVAGESCCEEMYSMEGHNHSKNCPSLGKDVLLSTDTYAIKATDLEQSCFKKMFYNCDLMRQAPAINAATLSKECCSNMFYNCLKLTLPSAMNNVNTLAEKCCESMFEKCQSLTESPILKAQLLVKDCYKNMFKDCTALQKVTCYCVNKPTDLYTSGWMSGISRTGTFSKSEDAKWLSIFTMPDTDQGSYGYPLNYGIWDTTKPTGTLWTSLKEEFIIVNYTYTYNTGSQTIDYKQGKTETKSINEASSSKYLNPKNNVTDGTNNNKIPTGISFNSWKIKCTNNNTDLSASVNSFDKLTDTLEITIYFNKKNSAIYEYLNKNNYIDTKAFSTYKYLHIIPYLTRTPYTFSLSYGSLIPLNETGADLTPTFTVSTPTVQNNTYSYYYNTSVKGTVEYKNNGQTYDYSTKTYGYEYDSWTKPDGLIDWSGSATLFSFKMPNKNINVQITYKARVYKITMNKIIQDFFGNTGRPSYTETIPNNGSINYNQDVSVTVNFTETQTNYRFKGWNFTSYDPHSDSKSTTTGSASTKVWQLKDVTYTYYNTTSATTSTDSGLLKANITFKMPSGNLTIIPKVETRYIYKYMSDKSSSYTDVYYWNLINTNLNSHLITKDTSADTIYYTVNSNKLHPNHRVGYLFSGWGVLNNNNTSLIYESIHTPVTVNRIYYAIYSRKLSLLTVSVPDGNGSATIEGTNNQTTQYVDYQDVKTIKVTPDTGYEFDTMSITANNTDGAHSYGSTLNKAERKITMGSENTTVSVSFKKQTYTVTVILQGKAINHVECKYGNTTLKNGDIISVEYNTLIQLTANINTEAAVKGLLWTIGSTTLGSLDGTGTKTISTTVRSNMSITLEASIKTYTITVSTGAGYSATLYNSSGNEQSSTLTGVEYGTTGYYVSVSANKGYKIDSVSGAEYNSTKKYYEISTITGNKTIQISASQISYTVTCKATNGTLTASPTSAYYGASITLSPTASPGYGSIQYSSVPEVSITDNTFTMPAQNITVTATWTAINYKITGSITNGSIVFTTGNNGNLDTNAVHVGDKVYFKVTPNDTTYTLTNANVTFKNGSTSIATTDNKDGRYHFTMPAGDVSYSATAILNEITITLQASSDIKIKLKDIIIDYGKTYDIKITKGSSYTLPTTFEPRTSYFETDGWEGNLSTYDKDTTIKLKLKLYYKIKYLPTDNFVDFTVKLNGAAISGDQTKYSSQTFTGITLTNNGKLNTEKNLYKQYNTLISLKDQATNTAITTNTTLSPGHTYIMQCSSTTYYYLVDPAMRQTIMGIPIDATTYTTYSSGSKWITTANNTGLEIKFDVQSQRPLLRDTIYYQGTTHSNFICNTSLQTGSSYKLTISKIRLYGTNASDEPLYVIPVKLELTNAKEGDDNLLIIDFDWKTSTENTLRFKLNENSNVSIYGNDLAKYIFYNKYNKIGDSTCLGDYNEEIGNPGWGFCVSPVNKSNADAKFNFTWTSESFTGENDAQLKIDISRYMIPAIYKNTILLRIAENLRFHYTETRNNGDKKSPGAPGEPSFTCSYFDGGNSSDFTK